MDMSKKMTIGGKYKNDITRSPGPGDFDTDASFILTKGSIIGGPYIASDNDFEGRNSFQVDTSIPSALNKSTLNKYLLKNMSPDTRNKVMNMNQNQTFTVSSKKILK